MVPQSIAAKARRTLRRGLTWRPKILGREALDIRELISPFRYDVVVRAQFFDAIAAARPDAASLPQFITDAQNLPYAVWFREVELRRFFPWVLRDDAQVARAFARRVEGAVHVYNSFATHGFDLSCPVTLRSPLLLSCSDSGVSVHRPLHLGDGGHRLALLLRSGRPLEPGMFRIDTRPSRVIDNTAILAPQLGLTEAEWVGFVSATFVHEPRTSYASLRRALQDSCPDRLPELESLASAHHLLETCL